MANNKGYQPYKPHGKNAAWLRAAEHIIYQYKDNWPLTARQIFYRMVASVNYPKTETAYKALAAMLAKARRASLVQNGTEVHIPFNAIRDDTMRIVEVTSFDGTKDFMQSVVQWSKGFMLDRQIGQEQVIEAWCEAGGMVPILADLAFPFGIRVNSNGGYDSVTSKHKLADRVVKRAREQRRPTIVLHVGDFDPSGENMCNVLHEDVLTMVCQRLCSGKEKMSWSEASEMFSVERVALTARQVIEYNVITAPPKPSDSRMEGFLEQNWELTVQGAAYLKTLKV